MDRKWCERLTMNVCWIRAQVLDTLSTSSSSTCAHSTISTSIGYAAAASGTGFSTGRTYPASKASNANSKSPYVYISAVTACSSSKPMLLSVYICSGFSCSLVICLPNKARGSNPSGIWLLCGFICLLIFYSEKRLNGSRKPPEQSMR